MERAVVQRVWEIAEPVVDGEGLELVDVEFRSESRGAVLRFFLDREGGINVEDLARLSRRLGDILDAHDVVPRSYTLEVSSPGLNRRLRRPDHFRRYLGKRVQIRTNVPLSGRRNWVGVLRAVEDRGVLVGAGEGAQFVCFSQIARANYEHDFGGGAGAKPRKRIAPR